MLDDSCGDLKYAFGVLWLPAWPQFMAELMRIGYDGPLCIEVEDDTFGKTLEGRMKAIKVARNVLAPFFG